MVAVVDAEVAGVEVADVVAEEYAEHFAALVRFVVGTAAAVVDVEAAVDIAVVDIVAALLGNKKTTLCSSLNIKER